MTEPAVQRRVGDDCLADFELGKRIVMYIVDAHLVFDTVAALEEEIIVDKSHSSNQRYALFAARVINATRNECITGHDVHG